MPRVGMEVIRREGLVNAAIEEIGHSGSLDVTVSQIARRAGVSSALAHHYFGTKEEIFLSAMRRILSMYADEVRARLADASSPRQRLECVIRASFAESNFRQEVIAAWLYFYVRAQNSQPIARLHNVYRARLRSNLLAGLRPLLAGDAETAAEGIAAMIDGLYVRQSLSRGDADPEASAGLVIDYLDRLLERRP